MKLKMKILPSGFRLYLAPSGNWVSRQRIHQIKKTIKKERKNKMSEKYKYKFLNSYGESHGDVEAESLNEAIVRAGFNGYIARYSFPGFAVIDNGKFSFGVKWEPVSMPTIAPINSNELNSEEENLIKDILKYIGNTPGLTTKFARQCLGNVSGAVSQFNTLADSIFGKCQNGRLTVEIN